MGARDRLAASTTDARAAPASAGIRSASSPDAPTPVSPVDSASGLPLRDQVRNPAADAPALPLREPAPVTGPITLRERRVGLSDLRIFPLALGATSFGSHVPERAARSILDTYVDLGGNVVDTADDDGVSQTLLGDWIRDRRRRDDLVIATKIGCSTAHPGVSVGSLTRAVEGSLQRLRTDRIDLLWLGVDDDAVPLEETLLGASALVRSGKVRQIGLADHSGNRMIEARVIAAQHGATPVVAVQTEYSLLERSGYEPVIAGVVRQLALAVMPRSSLACGILARTYPDDRRLRIPRRGELRTRRVLAELEAVAREHHVPLATVAVAWLLSKSNVVAPVVGASSPEQVLDLIAATSLQLTRHQLTRLDRVSEQRPRRAARRRADVKA